VSYRLEIGLAALLVLAIAVALRAGSSRTTSGELDFRSSTFVTSPRGSKALHDILQRLGLRSERRRTSLDNLTTQRGRRPAILVVLNPVLPLDEDEIVQVVRYVRAGGSLVTSGWGGGLTRCTGWRTQPTSRGADSMGVRLPEPGLHLPYAARVLTPYQTNADRARLDALAKADPDDEDDTPGICSTLAAYGADTIVAALNKRPVILRLRYRGGGSITLVADHRWFTNQVWRDTDMPIVAVPLLTPGGARPGRVVWDEYHQGFGERGGPSVAASTWNWLRTTPGGWIILQLIAVALVWLTMTAVRFGPARHVVERRRRSPLEHLEALGAGLESAEDADTAVQRLAQGLRRRLSRAGHAGDGKIESWLESLELAMRRQKGRTAVRRLHHLLTAREPGNESARVLQAAQAVEDVWEELRPPSRPLQTHNA
jgi:hypothetical protein